MEISIKNLETQLKGLTQRGIEENEAELQVMQELLVRYVRLTEMYLSVSTAPIEG